MSFTCTTELKYRWSRGPHLTSAHVVNLPLPGRRGRGWRSATPVVQPRVVLALTHFVRSLLRRLKITFALNLQRCQDLETLTCWLQSTKMPTVQGYQGSHLFLDLGDGFLFHRRFEVLIVAVVNLRGIFVAPARRRLVPAYGSRHLQQLLPLVLV